MLSHSYTLREKLQSRSRSIKTLDYAMSGSAGSASCEAFVEALGLKTLFSALMGKVSAIYVHLRIFFDHFWLQTSKKQIASGGTSTSEDTSHILGILSSLFSNIASETPARVRLLTKFVENNYEKVDKLLEIRDNAQSRLSAVEAEIGDEKKVRSILVLNGRTERHLNVFLRSSLLKKKRLILKRKMPGI